MNVKNNIIEKLGPSEVYNAWCCNEMCSFISYPTN